MIQVLEKTSKSVNLYYITFEITFSLAVFAETFTPSVSQNITLAFYNLILSSFESYGFMQRIGA